MVLSEEEIEKLITDTSFWEDIDVMVSTGRMDIGGLPYARPPWAWIAREAARLWRERRSKDPTLARLLIEDFREYLRSTYDDYDL